MHNRICHPDVSAFNIPLQKTSYPFIGIAFLLPFIFPVENDLARYLFVIAVGIVVAYGNWFVQSYLLYLADGITFVILLVLSLALSLILEGLKAFVLFLFGKTRRKQPTEEDQS